MDDICFYLHNVILIKSSVRPELNLLILKLLRHLIKKKGGKFVKKILILTLLCAILSACRVNDSRLSFSEIKIVPNEIQTLIKPHNTLQLVNEEDGIAYIVYQTKKTVTTDIESREETVNVQLNVSNRNNKDLKQHVYKLTLDPNHEVIDVYINGKSTSFDNVTGL